MINDAGAHFVHYSRTILLSASSMLKWGRVCGFFSWLKEGNIKMLNATARGQRPSKRYLLGQTRILRPTHFSMNYEVGASPLSNIYSFVQWYGQGVDERVPMTFDLFPTSYEGPFPALFPRLPSPSSTPLKKMSDDDTSTTTTSFFFSLSLKSFPLPFGRKKNR